MNFFKSTRKIVASGVLGAIGLVLMALNFNIPSLMPSFIKFDVSELPSVIATFAYGPMGGIMVCLVKNVLNFAFFSGTGGIGELSNFLLGCAFVIPAGLIYQKHRTFKGAIVASLIGCACASCVGWFTNYFIIYPLYFLIYPKDVILGMYEVVFGFEPELWQALLYFNVPFTFVKCLFTSFLTFLVYKKLHFLLHGKKA